MNILHGTWIPDSTDNYVRKGSFYLWIETELLEGKKEGKLHPACLRKDKLHEFLKGDLGIKEADNIKEKYFLLPTIKSTPLPSYELIKHSEEEVPEDFQLKQWKIFCYKVNTSEIIKLLKDINFLFFYNPGNIRPGSDILFWYHFTQLLREIILKDNYIPSLKYRELEKKKNTAVCEIYPSWEIISEKYEFYIEKQISFMPQICVAGSDKEEKDCKFFSKKTILRHFSENLLNDIIWNTDFTGQFIKEIRETFLYDCIYPFDIKNNIKQWHNSSSLEEYKKWYSWKEQLGGKRLSNFTLCFKLEEALSLNDKWNIHFLLESKEDPSLKIELHDYWHMKESKKKQIWNKSGYDMDKEILLNLGYAAKIYPDIWTGLETDKPEGFKLDIEKAFDFLKEKAWILEDAGYKIIIPSWYTPQGRRKAKIKVKTSVKTPESISKGFFNIDTIIQYDYELAIGNEIVSRKEWNELVNAKTDLVRFRGEWMELDRDKMEEIIKFWQNNADKKGQSSMLDIIKMTAEEEKFLFSHDDILSDIMDKLHDKSRFQAARISEKFQGTLREYQKRGLSWITYLENLGLNACLADDMGLGKTIQVIARIINEREEKKDVLPTLLIAPTSVTGNWKKEFERFAPHIKTFIHHGNLRYKKEKEFKEESMKYDVIISSYALARKDEKLFRSLEWERVVLDEAQNIKNPVAAQTKAILKIKAKHRLALTGTPVENRLLDLWSIFNFLNHGYLETQAKFRTAFEIPVQKDNDLVKTKILKSLVEPFILRRVKTDKDIIKDLPDKVEQKIYCNLSKEQASLYEAVVKDILEELQDSEGIKRKGLILSSLMRLKQICNHPAQFLQDGSYFTKERSNKLSRLAEMTEEAIESGESILIFSQFREVCIELEKLFKKDFYYNTYLLHGGTGRIKRQQIIEEFQNPETEPSVFILSLKAGGVGITLTRANHVFHFDRWWNPSVENQATDRAFRIGQEKNVFVHKFVTMGTLEERIDEMIEQKKKLAGSIIGSDESWLTELDNDAFKELISLNKNYVWE